MGYIRKWWDTPYARVVEEYHTREKPPPEGRGKRRKPTPEEMAAANKRVKERNARLLIMANFREEDYYITLTYRKEDRPEELEECKKHFRSFIRKVQYAYRKAGEELKWMRNIEKGSRGGIHIHMILNRIPDTDVIIRRAWKYGGVHTALLYADGGFKKLAEYMTKEGKRKAGKDEEGEESGKESSYSTSRNLKRPKPRTKKMSGKTFREKIRIPEGYTLDKESSYEGINGYTGYPYRYYTLLTNRRRE